jgi:hypothetical protein
MNTVTPAIRDLARRLIALEAARGRFDEGIGAASRTCERLQVPLEKLVGQAGFCSLLSRALAVAKAQVPSLGAVQIRPNGSLEGLGEIERSSSAEAESAIVAQLLGLLVTFIGEPLTLRLVRDAWPDGPESEIDAGIGEGS